MPAVIQMLMLLAQILPAALKALAAWQEYHGQALTRANRQKLASDIKAAVTTAVESKNTSNLEAVLKSLGKPPT